MRTLRLHAGIFLISLAALALEVHLIRLFSIAQWYHFAFLVVSIALFGIAAAGTFLTVRKLKNPLFHASMLFAMSVIVSYFMSNAVVFDPYRALIQPRHLLVILAYYLVLGLPFFFFGIIIAHTLARYKRQAGIVYSHNLIGSAAGALLAVFLAPIHAKAFVIIASLGLVAALVFLTKPSALARFSVLGMFALLAALAVAPLDIAMSDYKELSQALNVPGARLLETHHTAFGRIDIVESSFTRYAPGLSLAFSGALPDQLGVTIDGGSMNAITDYDERAFINNLPSTVGYAMVRPAKVLVINAGGGLDVLAALNYNATVTAVENNPTVTALLKDQYAGFSGDIYNRADVEWGSGRGIEGHYDLIVLSISGDVVGAPIAGLIENYQLTADAFREYYDALNDKGLLVVTRWLSFPPRESLRLLSLALEIDPDAQQTALIRSLTTVTLVVSKAGLDAAERQALQQFADLNKFDIIYMPGSFIPNRHLRFPEPHYARAAQQLIADRELFYESYVFDVSPVTDERPFYFNFFKVTKVRELRQLMTHWNPLLDPSFLLLAVALQATLLSIVFVLLPIRFVSRPEPRKLSFFFAIGFAYLFVEIVLIQKMVLFLGHIVVTSATVIAALLLFSGIGARCSQLVRSPFKPLVIVGVLIILYSVSLELFLHQFLSASLPARITIAAVTVAPLGFVMGLPFPLAIRSIRKELVPWAWAVNGTASVLSPVAAIAIALFAGYRIVLLLAAALYLLSLVLIPAPFRSAVQTSQK